MNHAVLKRLSLGSNPLRASLLALSLTLGGCFATHVNIQPAAPGVAYSQWVHGWLWGAIGGHVDAGLCAGRPVASITTRHSVGNVLAFIFTLGLYAPTSVHIACGQFAGYGGAYPPQAQPYQPPPAPNYQPQPQPYQPQPQPYQPQPQPYQPPASAPAPAQPQPYQPPPAPNYQPQPQPYQPQPQ